MFSLTREERFVFIAFVATFLVGIGIQAILRAYPCLADIVNIADSDKIYPRIDLNHASADDLEKLPSLGPVLAQRIVDYRQEKGLFKSVAELKAVVGISPHRYQKISKFLKINTHAQEYE